MHFWVSNVDIDSRNISASASGNFAGVLTCYIQTADQPLFFSNMTESPVYCSVILVQDRRHATIFKMQPIVSAVTLGLTNSNLKNFTCRQLVDRWAIQSCSPSRPFVSVSKTTSSLPEKELRARSSLDSKLSWSPQTPCAGCFAKSRCHVVQTAWQTVLL